MSKTYLTLYIVFLTASGAITFWLSLYVWFRRKAMGTLVFSALMAASTLWSVSIVFMMLSNTVEAAMLWEKIMFVGVASVPVSWFLFTLLYTGYGEKITRTRLVLLFSIPVLSILANNFELSGYWLKSIEFKISEGYMIPEFVPGLGFKISVTYFYILIVCGIFLCMRLAIRSFNLYRKQALALIIGSLAPLIASVPIIFGYTRLSYSPIGFLISGAAFSLALFRFQLLDILPVARETLIDNMADGMIVLDPMNRIVDINRAAMKILDDNTVSPIGQPINIVSTRFAEWENLLRDDLLGQIEVSHEENGIKQYFDLKISHIHDWRGIYTGQLLVLHDISRRKQAENERERLISELKDALANVKTLSGLLPICATCKKIRDDKGYWHQVEAFVHEHSGAEFSHGICPECTEKYYPELFKKGKK